jgi:hypothetical protein
MNPCNLHFRSAKQENLQMYAPLLLSPLSRTSQRESPRALRPGGGVRVRQTPALTPLYLDNGGAL